MTEKLQHIAFIMDGNSTWAKSLNKPIMDGYLKGMQNLADTVLALKKHNVKYATFYVFSSENWQRPSAWISSFMQLAKRFIQHDQAIKRLLNAKARLNIIGDTTKLDNDLKDILNTYVEKTKNNEGINVQLAISYGGRDEIVRSARRILDQRLDFTEDNFSKNMDTNGIPDPELIIRTSGKQRLSNFLLWQASYSELYFTDKKWPDFNEKDLAIAIDDYSKRKRTYGK